MPVELGDNTFHVICPTCYNIIPKIRYMSHKNSKSCYLPVRPPEDTPDKSSCKTCHQTFESVEANDLHEPCEAANNYTPARQNRRRHIDSSLMNTKARQRDVRLSMMATDRIAVIYRAALRKPNVDGTYNVNGQVMSLQELKRHIWNLSRQVRINI